jgi:hypothetical protein
VHFASGRRVQGCFSLRNLNLNPALMLLEILASVTSTGSSHGQDAHGGGGTARVGVAEEWMWAPCIEFGLLLPLGRRAGDEGFRCVLLRVRPSPPSRCCDGLPHCARATSGCPCSFAPLSPEERGEGSRDSRLRGRSFALGSGRHGEYWALGCRFVLGLMPSPALMLLEVEPGRGSSTCQSSFEEALLI